MKVFPVHAPGRELTVKLYGKTEGSKPKPVCIFLAGWSPSKHPWTPADLLASSCAAKCHYICATVFPRGLGSPGDIRTLTRADFLEDFVAMYDYIAARDDIDPERVYLAGESFGSYMACLLAAARPVAALILRVPTDFPNDGFATRPHHLIAGRASIGWRLQKHSPEESFSLQAVHFYSGKIFIIASGKDVLVPRQTIENYLSAAHPDMTSNYLMKKARHSLANPVQFIKFKRILREILGNLPAPGHLLVDVGEVPGQPDNGPAKPGSPA